MWLYGSYHGSQYPFEFPPDTIKSTSSAKYPISRALRDNFKSGLLSGGIDLSSGSHAGAVVVGGKEQLDNINEKKIIINFLILIQSFQEN